MIIFLSLFLPSSVPPSASHTGFVLEGWAVGYVYDIAWPLQLALSDGCRDATDVCFFHDTDAGLPIFPGDLEDLAETSLVVLFQGLQMSAVGCPAISPIEQSGQDYCLVNK